MRRYTIDFLRYTPSNPRFPIGARVRKDSRGWVISGGAFGRALCVLTSRVG